MSSVGYLLVKVILRDTHAPYKFTPEILTQPRAAISVMSNIAEGYARRSDKAFANFLHIAHGSAAEVQSQLYIALDLKYITQDDFNKAYALCEEINRQTQTFIKYLNTSQLPNN